jgi:hypothetical protein
MDPVIKNEYAQILLIMGSMMLVIVQYSRYRCQNPEFKDKLQEYPFRGENSVLKEIADGWSISHFVFFMCLGYRYPDHYGFVLALGALWEGMEFATERSDIEILDKMRGLATCKNDNSSNFWWYGKYTDLLMNAAGFYVGRSARELFIY